MDDETRSKGGFKDNPQNINREGRVPSGESIADLLKLKMQEEKTIELRDKKGRLTGKKRTATIKELFIEAVLKNALAGREQSQKTVMNYYDGYPKQNIEVEGRFATIHTDIPLTPEQEERYAEKLDWLYKDVGDDELGADIGGSSHQDERNNDVDGPEISPDS